MGKGHDIYNFNGSERNYVYINVCVHTHLIERNKMLAMGKEVNLVNDIWVLFVLFLFLLFLK